MESGRTVFRREAIDAVKIEIAAIITDEQLALLNAEIGPKIDLSASTRGLSQRKTDKFFVSFIADKVRPVIGDRPVDLGGDTDLLLEDLIFKL